MHKSIKHLIFCLIFGFFAISCFAQIKINEKRIYLFDLTASMIGEGSQPSPNILNDLKQMLSEAINTIEDTCTEVVIIPFTSTTFPKFETTIAQKDSLLSYIHSLDIRPGDTNIVDAIEAGEAELNPDKINYMFILTDGMHNYKYTKDKLYNQIGQWPTKSNDNYYFAFYAMLTDNADEKALCDTINTTDNFWTVKSLNVNAALIATYKNAQANIFKGQKVKLEFWYNSINPIPDSLKIDLKITDNPYYELDTFENLLAKDKALLLSFKEKVPKNNIPSEWTTKLSIILDKEKYPLAFFTPEKINFKIINRGVQEVSIVNKLKSKTPYKIEFGAYDFDEPFKGIFKGLGKRPKVFRNSTHWPLFSSTLADTGYLKAKMIIHANDEVIRHKTDLDIAFVDSNFNAINGVKFLYKGKEISAKHPLRIKPNDSTFTVPIELWISPAIGKTNLNGFIIAKSPQVNRVNETEIQSEYLKVGDFHFKHTVSGAFWFWFIWLLIFILGLLILWGIIWLIYTLFEIKKASKENNRRKQYEQNQKEKERTSYAKSNYYVKKNKIYHLLAHRQLINYYFKDNGEPKYQTIICEFKKINGGERSGKIIQDLISIGEPVKFYLCSDQDYTCCVFDVEKLEMPIINGSIVYKFTLTNYRKYRRRVIDINRDTSYCQKPTGDNVVVFEVKE